VRRGVRLLRLWYVCLFCCFVGFVVGVYFERMWVVECLVEGGGEGEGSGRGVDRVGWELGEGQGGRREELMK